MLALAFSFLLVNPLSVAAWELFQLRWLRNKNPFQTIFNIWDKNGCVSKCFYNIDDDQENKMSTSFDPNAIYIIEKVTNFFSGVLFYIYIWTLIE